MTPASSPGESKAAPVRGVSLVELLLVIAIGSIVLAVVGSGFASLMRLDREFSDGRSEWAKQSQLVSLLRRDGHECTRFRFDEASRTLSFSGASEAETRYSFNDGMGKRESVGKKDAPMLFRTPKDLQWSVSPPSGVAGDLITITFALSNSLGEGRRLYSVKIALGRDTGFIKGVGR